MSDDHERAGFPNPPNLKVVSFTPRPAADTNVEEQEREMHKAAFRDQVTKTLSSPGFEKCVVISLNADGSFCLQHVGDSKLEAIGLLALAQNVILSTGYATR